MEKSKVFLTSSEDRMRRLKALGQDETLEQYLSKSFVEIKSTTDKYLDDLNEWAKKGPNGMDNWFLLGMVFGLNEALYYLQTESKKAKVRTNAVKLRNHIGVLLISRLSPLVVNLLKWDIDRRTWKNPNDEYKIAFLRKQVTELDHELNGTGPLLQKYVPMLCDFVIAKLDEHLHLLDDEDYSILETDEEYVYETREKIVSMVGSKEFLEMLKDSEPEVLNFIRPKVIKYIEGRLSTTDRFDPLIYAFIEAQNDYKKFLQGLLISIERDDLIYFSKIRIALESKDVAKAISILQTIFGSIPNQLLKKSTEAHYHISLHVILKMIGCDVYSEVSTNLGRIDAVVEFDQLIYIMEFKLSSASEAMTQILDREYAQSHVNKGKEVYLLGISFDTKKRNIRSKYELSKVRQD